MIAVVFERTGRPLRATALVGCLLVASACEEPLTQLVVVVDSDLQVPEQLEQVEIRVEEPGGDVKTRTAVLDEPGAPSLPLSVGVVANPPPAEPVKVRATGSTGGRDTVTQAATTRFVAGETRMVRLLLLRQCVGTSCPEGKTCGRDGCGSPQAPPGMWAGSPPMFDGGQEMSVTDIGTPRAIGAGAQHACLVNEAGEVYCWGRNADGQLGVTPVDSRAFAVRVDGVAEARAVAAGDFHSCALRQAGDVRCWGRGRDGELGHGETVSRQPTPVSVAELDGASAIAAGAAHTCALREGEVLCWGFNGSGQLGRDPSTERGPTPAAVPGIGNAVKIAAGRKHTCAVDAEGNVLCWGDNARGQLGDGTTSSSSSPVAVTGLEAPVDEIAAGGNHTCALSGTGGLDCWGFNAAGQLGVSSGATVTTPQSLDAPTDVAAVAAGDSHTCALAGCASAEGCVFCWGNNARGQLGDGTTEGGAEPVRVGMLKNRVELVTGVAFSCARRAGGVVSCWGANSSGQLGTGRRSSEVTEPVLVELMPPL